MTPSTYFNDLMTHLNDPMIYFIDPLTYFDDSLDLFNDPSWVLYCPTVTYWLRSNNSLFSESLPLLLLLLILSLLFHPFIALINSLSSLPLNKQTITSSLSIYLLICILIIPSYLLNNCLPTLLQSITWSSRPCLLSYCSWPLFLFLLYYLYTMYFIWLYSLSLSLSLYPITYAFCLSLNSNAYFSLLLLIVSL